MEFREKNNATKRRLEVIGNFTIDEQEKIIDNINKALDKAKKELISFWT